MNILENFPFYRKRIFNTQFWIDTQFGHMQESKTLVNLTINLLNSYKDSSVSEFGLIQLKL